MNIDPGYTPGGTVIDPSQETEQGVPITRSQAFATGISSSLSMIDSLTAPAPSASSGSSSRGGILSVAEHAAEGAVLKKVAKGVWGRMKGAGEDVAKGAEDVASDVPSGRVIPGEVLSRSDEFLGSAGRSLGKVGGEIGKLGDDATEEGGPLALAAGAVFGRGKGLPTGSAVRTTGIPGQRLIDSGINGALNTLNPGQWINGNNEREIKSWF
jgi:hypothetical protein